MQKYVSQACDERHARLRAGLSLARSLIMHDRKSSYRSEHYHGRHGVYTVMFPVIHLYHDCIPHDAHDTQQTLLL